MGLRLRTFDPTGLTELPPFDAATTNVINNMTQAPSFGQKLAIKALVEALENSGAWANISILSIFNAQTTQAALFNWKNPAGAIWTNTNGATFTAFGGYAGNGTNATLTGPTWTTITGLSPAYAQNNATVAVWQGANVSPSNSNFCAGVNAAGQPFLLLGQDANKNANFRSNATTSDLLPCPYGVNVIGTTRNASGTYNAWINKQKHIITRASTGVPTGADALMLLSASASFSLGTVCAVMVGVALTDAQYLAAVQAVQSYIDTVSGSNSQVPAYWGVDGAWSWFNHPRAITVNGNDVLAVASNVGGSQVVQNPMGTPPVRSLIVPNTTFGQDDHSAGAVIQLPTAGKVVAMEPPNEGGSFWNALSANANDASSFAASTNIFATLTAGGQTSLTNVVMFLLTATNTIWAFIRAITSGAVETQHYTTSTNGTTWAALTQLLWSNRPYLLGVVNGTNRIEFALSDGNPGDGLFTYNNIYHMTYNAGTWQNSAGTSMGSPPFTQSQVTKVYDSQAGGDYAWQWDIKVNGSGNPVILYARFNNHGGSAGANTTHAYYQAVWNGTSWVSTKITEAGGTLYPANKATQPYYSGGMCMDPTNTNIVYASLQVDASGQVDTLTPTGTFQLFKFVNNNGVWTGTQLTFDQNNNSFRPYIVPNENGNGGTGAAATVYYCFGSYPTYQTYACTIQGLAINLGS